MSGSKDFLCIERLKEIESPWGLAGYYNHWEAIKMYYSECYLDKKPITTEENIDGKLIRRDYTPHDYESHCTNIYNMISNVLLRDSLSELTDHELFILNVAVVLHDIAMFITPEQRETHSLDGRNYINKTFFEGLNAKDPALAKNLHAGDVKCIANVVYGHSDIKGQDGGVQVHTLAELMKEQIIWMSSKGVVRVPQLAGILRFADALDIGALRIEQVGMRQNISDDSREHWRKCEIFDTPTWNKNDIGKVVLTLHEQRIITDGDCEADALRAREVLDGLQKELASVRGCFRANVGDARLFHIADVDLIIHDEMIKKYFDNTAKKAAFGAEDSSRSLEISETVCELKKCDKIFDPAAEQVVGKEGVPNPLAEEGVVNPLNEALSDKIERWVVDDRLLQSDHFKVGGVRCARDWIETTKLLGNRDYLGRISAAFVQHIKDNFSCDDKLYIVAYGFPALILASQIGLRSSNPFSYIVSAEEEDPHPVAIPAEAKVILVADVVVTGNSILNAMDRLGINNDKCVAVFSIFYRPPYTSKEPLLSEVQKKLICLNNTIPIELCDKPDICFFNRNKLIRHRNEPLWP